MSTAPTSRHARAALMAVVVALLTGCTAATPARSLTDLPVDTAASNGALDDNYIDPDAAAEPGTSEPVNVPPDTALVTTLPDPAAFGLTADDEVVAAQAGVTFLETIWTWDGTDTSDRAGLERALPLATAGLADELRQWIDQPIYTPDQWAALVDRSDVGSAIVVLQARPAVDGAFDSDTYTLTILYRRFIASPGGLLASPEEARYATLVLTRTPTGTWLVADLPLQGAEQVIEAGPIG